MPSFKATESIPEGNELTEIVAPYGHKIAWFLSHGYDPFTLQLLFHCNRNPHTDRLCRFRHLVAGRRGGKTLSAAWEMLYYLLNPQQFHRDVHNKESQQKLLCWVLTKDYPAGLPALLTFREVLREAGMENGKDYKENRGNRWFEFENGSFLFFKTADEPDSLRGAGLDILWMDEAAFIPNEDAWNVVRPSLSDKLGIVIATTTPSGKNWFYDEFWSDDALTDENIGRVEYWSIHNPYFSREEWEYVKSRFHPLLFKQEFQAAFDSMAGKELSGEWLHYYTFDELPKKEGKLELDFYIGIDPAVSLSDNADKFALSVIGVTRDNAQAFLIDVFSGRIPFSEQIEKIQEYWHIYRPLLIGVESNAFQASLAQQTARIKGLPPILPVFSRGKKYERILRMAPLFRMSRIKIRKDQREFIDEWLDYDSTIKNPKDDVLDSVEIALSSLSAFLPQEVDVNMLFEDDDAPIGSMQELAQRSVRNSGRRKLTDVHLGSNW